MMKKILRLLALSGVLAISYGGVVSAAWPGTSWTPVGSGVPVRLIVEKGYVNGNLVHWRDTTNFSVYFHDDTRASTDIVQIIFTPVNDSCNNMGGAPNIRIYHPGNSLGDGRSGDCSSPTSISFRKNQTNRRVWHPDQNVTEYRITVNLEDEDGETRTTGYGFMVSSPQEPTARFGVTPGREVVFIADKDQGGFTDISITQQPACAGQKDGTFTSYDYDNFIGSRAQQDSSGEWRPMSVALQALPGGYAVYKGVDPDVTTIASSGSTNRRGWYILSSPANTYRPQDTDTDQKDEIVYDGQSGTKYQYVLRDFGRNNFIGLTLPWTGNPFSCPSSATITPRASVGGGGSSGSGITVEPGTTVTFHNYIETSGLMNAGANTYTWSITGQGANSGDTRLLTQPVLDNSSTQYTTSFSAPGKYCRQTRYLGSTLASGITVSVNPAEACVTVAAKPFFNVIGGDIMSDGGIKSWNETGSTSAAGSQLAALATGNIQNFVTGTGLGTFGSGSGLAFANTTASGTTYGGGYAVGAATPPTLSGSAISGSVNLGTIASGVYTATGNITIPAGTLAAGKQVTIVILNGFNLYISGNISYGSYSSVAQIPRLEVYALGGNISVAPTVTELHGIFYASSEFITCGTSTPPYTSVSLAGGAGYNTCNNPLTVYGSVTANKLTLSRTYKSLRDGIPAETFYYSPEVWLAPSGNSGSTTNTTYQSYISLPPVL